MTLKEYFKENKTTLATILICLLAVSGITWAVLKSQDIQEHKLYLIQVNPQSLKNKNENERRTWSTVCIDNAGKGLLSGQRSSSELPEACVKAAFALYPDKDWAAEAEANRKALDRF